MIVFAQLSDLTGATPPWLPTPLPANASSLLRSASILVAKAAQLSLYGAAPVDPAASALRDATCAQVQSWVARGVDPAQDGTDIPGPLKARSSSILDGTVSETRDTTAAVQAAQDARDGLCALATDLLQTAGLLWVPMPLGDEQGWLPRWGLDVPYWDNPWETGEPAATPPAAAPYADDLLLTELNDRFDLTLTSLDDIKETLMSFTPATTNVTILSGAPVVIASSTTSAALTLGKQHIITGSAAQPLTVPTPTVDGTIIGIKIADGSTASATLPASLQLSGVTGLTAGQDFDYVWSNSASAWSIK